MGANVVKDEVGGEVVCRRLIDKGKVLMKEVESFVGNRGRG